MKFVEVIAAGVATAISAYLLAHFGGLLPPSPTSVSAPAPTAVQVGSTASEVAESRRAWPLLLVEEISPAHTGCDP